MHRATTMIEFDPNAAATSDSGIFGLPSTEKESSLIYIPVPWDVTTSYGKGAASGPAAILRASAQMDLFDLDVERPYEAGLFLLGEPQHIRELNEKTREIAQPIIEGTLPVAELQKNLAQVNDASQYVNRWVYEQASTCLREGRIPGVIGGDHSVPLGAIQAAGEVYPSFGILHFDAHLDLRSAYQGFQHSHASIMNNVLKEIPAVKKLVQVGIRDFCEEEVEFASSQGDRVKIYFDTFLQNEKFEGTPWKKTTKAIVGQLPDQVWISFDIDGLDPRYCPHTGTPVPGGLTFAEAVFLIGEIVHSGKRVIGFDLVEVAPSPDFPDQGDEWDANVGMRLLYKISAWALASQGKARIRARY